VAQALLVPLPVVVLPVAKGPVKVWAGGVKSVANKVAKSVANKVANKVVNKAVVESAGWPARCTAFRIQSGFSFGIGSALLHRDGSTTRMPATARPSPLGFTTNRW
jgi:hypothetical protein